MVVQVNLELCAGCGVCVNACPVGAIQMVDQHAAIAEARCTRCEACIDACPNGAIMAVATQPNCAPIATLPVTKHGLVPAQAPAAVPEMAPASRGLAPLAGAALAYVGREVAPRLADLLIDALERRLTRPTTSAIAPQLASRRSFASRGRCERRRARDRRGRAGFRTYQERR